MPSIVTGADKQARVYRASSYVDTQVGVSIGASLGPALLLYFSDQTANSLPLGSAK